MATMEKLQPRKSYKVGNRLEPFYTGGPLSLSSGGDTVACACGDEVKLVQMSNGSVMKTFAGDSEPITSLAFTPNARILFTASRSLQTKKWDVSSGEVLRSWKSHEAPVADMAVDASGYLLATGSADRSARVWDVEKVHVAPLVVY